MVGVERKEHWLASNADESGLALPVTIETVRSSHQRRERQSEHRQAKAEARTVGRDSEEQRVCS